ncbi:hypothetical protein BMS3Bbin12_00005 [bacterium BMS3Bbin12]|nr:hypothetical protein BMS3Bbin12_00005 [bacterium BMS3Bbin12]GBE50282.1 hypothetical protein BMS3Bbin13_01214 [bacterium BMS3Bbin13]
MKASMHEWLRRFRRAAPAMSGADGAPVAEALHGDVALIGRARELQRIRAIAAGLPESWETAPLPFPEPD